MSSKSCKDCAAWQHNTYREWHYCAQGQGDICPGNSKACKYFKPSTVFQKITESPEVLVEKLVYDWGHLCHNGDIKIYWKSTILPDAVFGSKAEAYDATVAKLKEVCDE